jgi:hypothetical protein
VKKWYAITGILAILFIVSLVAYFSVSGQVAEAENELLIAKSDLANAKAELTEVANYLSDVNEELQSKRLEVEELKGYVEDAKFTFYYATRSEQRYGVDDLAEYIDRWEWIEGTYEAGEIDCSEMSAYLEWELENEGYHTVIVAKTTPGGLSNHAWLLIETSAGEYMPVEATNYQVVYWEHPQFDDYFVYDYEFETIQEALEYGPTEFDWWSPD